MKYLVLILLVFVVSGCSATNKIAREAVNIQASSQSIKDSVKVIQTNLPTNTPKIVYTELDSVDSNADDIIDSVNTVQRELPNTEDKVGIGWIITKWAVIGAVLLVVVFILWRTGAFILIRKLLGLGASIIPAYSSAKLLQEANENPTEENIRVATAVIRANDPKIDKQYRKVKKEKSNGNTNSS